MNSVPGEEIDEFRKIRSINVANISLGAAVKIVSNFHRIRSKMDGIKKELLELGYRRIEVVEDGFKFISISSTLSDSLHKLSI